MVAHPGAAEAASAGRAVDRRLLDCTNSERVDAYCFGMGVCKRPVPATDSPTVECPRQMGKRLPSAE